MPCPFLTFDLWLLYIGFYASFFISKVTILIACATRCSRFTFAVRCQDGKGWKTALTLGWRRSWSSTVHIKVAWVLSTCGLFIIQWKNLYFKLSAHSMSRRWDDHTCQQLSPWAAGCSRPLLCFTFKILNPRFYTFSNIHNLNVTAVAAVLT